MEMQSESSLIKKLSPIMAETWWVEKKGKNTFSNYDYARETDFLDAVRSKLAEYSVAVFTSKESMDLRETGKRTRDGNLHHRVPHPGSPSPGKFLSRIEKTSSPSVMPRPARRKKRMPCPRRTTCPFEARLFPPRRERPRYRGAFLFSTGLFSLGG
jgi:hypothetical protein